jgi:hypothetical protein
MTEDNTTQPPESTKFYAAILYPDGEYKVEEFADLAGLVSRMKELIDKDVSVFTFAGTQLKVSKPPFRHLLTPWGQHPLFALPQEMEPDETGYLGMDPIHLTDPPQLKVPKQKQNFADDSDEFFDDKEDNSLGVFDNILPDPDS